MRDKRNDRNVDELVQLWAQIAVIRQALRDQLHRAEADRERAAPEIAAAVAIDAGEVAGLLRDLVESHVTAARAALADLDRELEKRLGRASPPWDLLVRFEKIGRPGIAHERAIHFERAVIWLGRLAEHQRRRLRAARWRPGTPLPPRMNADPTTPGFKQLGAAASACIDAREVHERFHGRVAGRAELGDVGREIVRELQGESVANLLFGTAVGSGASSRAAAAAILGTLLGISGSAIVKALPQHSTDRSE